MVIRILMQLKNTEYGCATIPFSLGRSHVSNGKVYSFDLFVI